MKQGKLPRERQITREVHKLFWRANAVALGYLILCYATRPLAMFLYHIAIPVAVAYGVQATVARDMAEVYQYAWLVLAMAVGYCIFWAIGAWSVHQNGGAGAVYLQKTVFDNYLRKDYEYHTSTYVGALGAQVSQLRDAYIQYCQLVTLAVPKQLIVVVAGIAVIGWHSLQLALITLGAMVAVLSYTLWSSRWRLKWRRRVSEANAEMGGLVGDALSHGDTVKSFAAEDYEQKRMAGPAERWRWAQYRSWSSSIPADVGRMLLAAVATALLLIMTARLYIQGDISLAIVTLVQLYVIKLVAATFDIAEMIKSYETVMGGAYQPVSTMLVKSTVLDPERPRKITKADKQNITFENVTYTYSGMKRGAKAIRGFDLVVKPGEKVGLVGFSGSGKTTLTKLLLRYMDVTGGKITIGDIDIRQARQSELRQLIAYVPQEPLLFHRSIAENIAYGKPGASAKAIRAVGKAAYVDEFTQELPKGYDTFVGERGVKLSGGQRQRVAIARALLRDAPVLVLDEATSALDSRSEKLIQQALWKLMKSRTALVIAHRLSTIQRMDRIVVMDKGRIVQIGTHEQLLKDKNGIYAELWAHQSGGYVGVPTKVTEGVESA